jgi:hypothetical protein
LGNFPFKYLGVPLHYEKLRREDIQPVVDKVIDRIPDWQGRLLSYAARATLLGMTQKREVGGMGIPDLRDLNVCLLASWVQRFYTKDQKMWKSVVEHKYHPQFSQHILLC